MFFNTDISEGINLPAKTKKIYYLRAIRNNILFERQKLKKPMIEQEVLQENVDEGKPENPKYSFLIKCNSTDNNTDKNW